MLLLLVTDLGTEELAPAPHLKVQSGVRCSAGCAVVLWVFRVTPLCMHALPSLTLQPSAPHVQAWRPLTCCMSHMLMPPVRRESSSEAGPSVMAPRYLGGGWGLRLMLCCLKCVFFGRWCLVSVKAA